MSLYVIEYDENGCAWFISFVDKSRTPIEHGMIVDVVVKTDPCYSTIELHK